MKQNFVILAFARAFAASTAHTQDRSGFLNRSVETIQGRVVVAVAIKYQ